MSNTTGKELILALLTIASGFANGYLWQRAFSTTHTFENLTAFAIPIASLIVFAILFALSAAFIKSGFLRFLTAVLALILPFVLVPMNLAALISLGVSAIGAWFAASSIAAEQAASRTFSSRKLLRSGMPIFFTCLSLVLAVFYFTALGGESIKPFLPRSLFDGAITVIQKLADAQIIPTELRKNAQINAALETILAASPTSTSSINELILKRMNEEPDFRNLSQSEREAFVVQSRKALEEELGFPISGNERVSDLFYTTTNTQVAKFLGPYEKYLPFIAAVGLFITIKAFTLPLYWLTLILFFPVVRLMRTLKILRKDIETIQVERLSL